MKQGTNLSLKVSLDVDISLVSSIIFTMKYNKSIEDNVILQKTYDKNSSNEVEYSDNCFYIKFSQNETKDIDRDLYLQAQINYVDGYVDMTDIVYVKTNKSINVEVL